MEIKRKNKQAGFTIVETTVTLGIFVVVVFLIISIFTSSVKVERNVAEQTAVLDNLGLVIEQMARDIRTGTDFNTTFNGGLKLKSSLNNADITYIQVGDHIEKMGGDKPGSLTADTVKIDFLRFYLFDDEPGYPPRVTISIKAESPLFKEPIMLQTTVSERLFYYKKP